MSKLTTICAVMVFVLLGICTQATSQGPDELIAIADAVDKALNAHDLDLWLSYLTDDAVFDYVPLPTPLTGKEEIRAFFEEVFEGFPDFSTEEGRILAASNIVVVEHNMIGTLLGEWQGIPPTGNTGLTPHIDIYDFEGDKIKRMTTYYDVLGLMIQLGIMPAPEMPPLVPSFTLPDPEPTGLSPLEANAEMLARWNAHDMTGLAKMVHPEAQIMESAFGMADRDTFIASSELLFQGFSNIRGEFVRSIDMGDGWVAIELIFTGTHDGMYNGIPATGRVGTLRAAGIRRFDAEGLMTNFSLYYDNMTIIQQLTAEVDVEADIAAIEECLDLYAVGLNTGDLELWLSLHADDVVKMPPNAPSIFGQDALRAKMEPAFDNFTFEMALYPEETQVSGDLGFARGNYTVSMTPKAGGETIISMPDGKYSTIYKRQADGPWKILIDCYNSNLPPAQ
jgi:steroid delta-isomerase-like uncharacterized protein